MLFAHFLSSAWLYLGNLNERYISDAQRRPLASKKCPFIGDV